LTIRRTGHLGNLTNGANSRAITDIFWLKYRASWRDSVDSMSKKEAALTVGTKADSDSDWDDDVIYSRDPAE
jgi:hypothetical protein